MAISVLGIVWNISYVVKKTIAYNNNTHLMAIFQDNLDILFPFWILSELKAMEVVVTTGAIRHAKLQSNHHHRQTNTTFYRPNALPVTQPTVSKHWMEKVSHSIDLLFSRCLPTFSLTTEGSWLPWGGLPSLLFALWRQYPKLTWTKNRILSPTENGT